MNIMKKAILISSAAALLVAGGAAYAAPGNGDKQITRDEMISSLETRWENMDVNKDGQLYNADGDARRAERIVAMDTNGDDEVSQGEMDAHNANRKAERFAPADADGNGTLS